MTKPVCIAALANPAGWYFQDLQRAAELLGFNIKPIEYLDLAVQIPAIQNSSTSLPYDVVIARSMPLGSLEQVIFRMDALRHLESQGTRVVNSPIGLETAIDKSLTSIRFHQHKIPTPKTGIFQKADDAIAFFESNPDLVVKPIFGGEGRGLIRICEPEVAYRIFKSLERTNAVIYCQTYVEKITKDMRILLFGDKVFATLRTNENSWISNAAAGGMAESYLPTNDEIELAISAAKAVEVEVAGVDLIESTDQGLQVLEVNAVPGWKSLAKAVEKDIAKEILTYIRSSV